MKTTAFKIKKILIPLDLSDNSLLALEHGTFMARLFKADLVLVHVIETLVLRADLGKFSPLERKNAVQIVQQRLEEIAHDVKIKHGVKAHVCVKEGKIAPMIREAGDEFGVELIVMGTHGVSGFEEFFMGSNAYRVVTEAHCPVLTVQKHATKPGFQNILLPIDSSDATLEKVRYASELAKKYNAKITILGILSFNDEDVDEKMERRLEQVEKYLDKKEVMFESLVVEGDNLASVTLKQAKKLKADLICIMTEQEENLTGLFMGPFAQQVVNHSRIPVLSIKPMVE